MLTIGLTGHRILTQEKIIRQAIQAALARLDAAYPEQEWTLLTALAEGADTWLVQELLPGRAARLVVVLPLPLKTYLDTFSSPGGQAAFQELFRRVAEIVTIPPQPDTETAFRQAGEYIATYSDLLLAIWDGQSAQGPGGTGEVVALARRRGLPLVWIHAGNRANGTQIPTSLGLAQGRVTFERFPDRH